MGRNAGSGMTDPAVQPTLVRLWGLRLFWGLMLLGPCVALYIGFLDSPRLFDDLQVSLPDLLQPPGGLGARIVAQFSFWLNGLVSSQSIPGLRAGNLLIHLVNVLLVFQLCRALLSVAGTPDLLRAQSKEIAFASALLFSLHPVATYAVAYLIQRTILLSTCFALLCTLLHMAAQRRGRPWLYVAAIASFALSVFSKEHSVLLPVWLAVLSWWLHHRGEKKCTPQYAVFSGYALVIGLVIWVRATGIVFGGLYEGSAQLFASLPEHQHLTSAATQLVMYFRYLTTWLVPNPQWMSIDIQQDLPGFVLPWWGLLALCAFLGTAFLAVKQLRQPGVRSLIGLLYLGLVILFGTEMSVIRLAEVMVLYRSYLWMVLLPFVVVLLLFHATQRWLVPASSRTRAGVRALLCVCALLLSVATLNRLHSLSSEVLAWEDVVAKNQGVSWPGVSRGYNVLGVAYARHGRPDLAGTLFRTAIHFNPSQVTAYCNLATYYRNLGDVNAYLHFLNRGREIRPNHPCIQELDRVYPSSPK